MAKVNKNCIGCGACIAIDPDSFEFNDDGLAIVVDDTPTEAMKEAAECCPVNAIELE